MRLIDGDAVGRSALRKASWRLVPLIGVGYAVAYMDRVNISFAAVRMNQELGFSPTMYGVGAGLFFVSYALCEVPSNLLLVRFGARKWLTRIMLTWGLIAMGMMFVRTPHEFYAMRLLLGAAEAGYFPGVLYYLTEWFPPEYRARTISRFYIGLPLSSTVMGSVAGWLLGLNGRMGLRGWQWLFLLEGLPPLVMGALFWMYLPDTPKQAKWLTEDERGWLAMRLAESSRGKVKSTQAGGDLRFVLREPRLWLLAGFFLCTLTVLYAWTFSAPLILVGLTRWSVGKVGSLIAGLGLVGAAAMLGNAMSSDRSRERTWHIVAPCLVMAAGFVVGGVTGSAWLAVGAFAVAMTAYYAMQAPALTLPSLFLTGRAAAIGYGAMNTVAIAGGFLGPAWMGWAREWSGSYQRGLLSLAVPSVAAAGMIALLRSAREEGKGKAGA